MALKFSGQRNPATGTDPVKIVGPIFTGLGVIFLLVVCFLFWCDRQRTQDSQHITGHVTRLEYNNDGMTAPVVEYRYNGAKKFIVGTVWSSPPAYDVGEEVEILVSNRNDKDVTINSPFDRYFLPGIFAFFSIVFGGIGIALLYFMKN